MMRKATLECKRAAWIGVAAILLAGPAAAARHYPDISYRPTADTRDPARQTLDLYLPSRPGNSVPLLAFVHGSTWSTPDRQGLGQRIATALAARGIAVALVRFRLAPAHPHPAPQDDVAAALSWLARSAARFGYDPDRIHLAGHGAGAQIAALVALDHALREQHGLAASLPAGVVALGGAMDLERWAAQSPGHRRAVAEAAGGRPLADMSPIRRVRAGAAPFLVLSGAREPRHQQVGARRFTEALHAMGNREALWLSMPDRDFLSLLRLDDDNPATELVTGFVRGSYSEELGARLAARNAWRRPPFTTEGFWRHTALIREHATDQRFYEALLAVMPGEREQLNGWPLRRYFAIDLADYLNAVPRAQATGDWLAITNVNGERIVWRRSEIAAYGPRIVIGLDEERNLFRLTAFYRMRMEYSWRPGLPPPLMARPLGAFIYFDKDRPEWLRETIAGVTPEGIRILGDDPLASLAALPANLRAVLTHRHNCVACHDLRGTGARAHHLTAMGARRHGGFALPLAGYPEHVLRRFLFDQEGLARDFGITANVVAREDAEALYRLLTGRAGP
jgi:acetyl esterase/lipase